MHLFLQRLAVAQPDKWEEVGKEYLSYHARALYRIWKCAQTQNQMILQTYTYLRDAKAKSFVEVKLLGALALKWHGHSIYSLPKILGCTAPLQPRHSGLAPIAVRWI
jgi:hypothetical protein